MKILVAGHNGLVGSAIVRKLKAKGYRDILTVDKKKLNLLDQKAVFSFLSPKSLTNVFNYRESKGLETPALISPCVLWDVVKNGGYFAADVNDLDFNGGNWHVRAEPLDRTKL